MDAVIVSLFTESDVFNEEFVGGGGRGIDLLPTEKEVIGNSQKRDEE